VYSCIIVLKIDLLKVDTNGFPKSFTVVLNYVLKFSIFMHEIASFSEFAFMFLIKNFAFPCSVQLTVTPSVLCSEFFYSMSKFASILIWTIAFFHKIFAEFYLYLIFPHVVGDISLSSDGGLTFTCLKRITMLVIFLSLLLSIDG
jgi:hypothetical protein